MRGSDFGFEAKWEGIREFGIKFPDAITRQILPYSLLKKEGVPHILGRIFFF